MFFIDDLSMVQWSFEFFYRRPPLYRRHCRLLRGQIEDSKIITNHLTHLKFLILVFNFKFFEMKRLLDWCNLFRHITWMCFMSTLASLCFLNDGGSTYALYWGTFPLLNFLIGDDFPHFFPPHNFVSHWKHKYRGSNFKTSKSTPNWNYWWK